MTNASTSFVNEYCDINPLKSWYPSDNDNWQLRAPHVILAGVWNAGIRNVAKDLGRVFSRSKNDGFFLPKQFYRFQNAKKTKVYGARQRMYAQMYNIKLLKEQESSVANSSSRGSARGSARGSGGLHYYMDVSPGYLFYPQTIYHILCVAPWTKILVVLRDPVERLYRQWVYGKIHLKLTLSLEDWMAREMKVMQSVGLLSSSTTANNGGSRERERLAWKDYQSVPITVSGAIGRSLYVLQLEEWFDALRLAGKNPKDVVYVVPSEILLGENSESEYSKLFGFLRVSPSEPIATTSSSKATTTTSTTTTNNNNHNTIPPMKEETKKMLREFFAPYNERLANLLGNDFGEYDWRNVWKE
jgi:hypothetical protein